MVFCCQISFFCKRCFVAKSVLVRFTRFCVEKNLAKIFARGEKMTNMRYADWEGNQSYSNFLEVCKLAGVLTTINKPTTGFFLCQIWTIIRPPGLLQPQLLILTQVSPFSLSQLYFSRYIYSSLGQSQFAAIFVATFSGKCCSQLLRSDCFLFTSSSDNPSSCFDSNRQIGMSHSSFTRRTANMQRDL